MSGLDANLFCSAGGRSCHRRQFLLYPDASGFWGAAVVSQPSRICRSESMLIHRSSRRFFRIWHLVQSGTRTSRLRRGLPRCIRAEYFPSRHQGAALARSARLAVTPASFFSTDIPSKHLQERFIYIGANCPDASKWPTPQGCSGGKVSADACLNARLFLLTKSASSLHRCRGADCPDLSRGDQRSRDQP
jgi:hypothetical protein